MFPNEHSGRVLEPKSNAKFTRKNIALGIDGILMISGGKSEIQAYRFDKLKFTPGGARKWLKEKEVETVLFEPAGGGEMKTHECIECGYKGDEADGVCLECGADMLKTKEWGELKLETKEIKDVEICDCGTWNGIEITEKDMDEVIGNFRAGLVEPYLNIDHNDKLTDEMKAQLKVMSFGFVEALRREGTKLLANFKQVPKLIAELIEAGALKKRSVEWWKRVKLANGKFYNNVLKAVTFHGANGIPAVNTLSDVVRLFKEDKSIEQVEGEEVVIEFTGKGNVMEIDKKEFESLVALKGTAEKLASEIETIKKGSEDMLAKMKAMTEESAKLKAENEEAKKLKADIEKQTKENDQKEAVEFADMAIKAGKLLPKFKALTVEGYLTAKSKGAESLTLLKEEMDSRNQVINLGEVRLPDGTIQADGGTLKAKSETAEKAIQARMKAKGETWAQAAVALKLVEASDVGIKA